MNNESGIEPLGRAVLVEYYIPEQRESMIVIPDSVKDRANSVEQRAQIIEVGVSCWPDEPARAKAGDHVLISKMAGYQFVSPVNGKSYRMVNDRDIFARFTDAGLAAMEKRNG